MRNFLLFIGALWISAAHAQGTIGAFLTGEKLLEWCEGVDVGGCNGYLVGVDDTISLLKASVPEIYLLPNEYFVPKVEVAIHCAPQGAASSHLREVFVTYAKDHPEVLHRAAAPIVLAAYQERFPCTPQKAHETERAQLIRPVQFLLAELGYDPGTVDGVSGPLTQEAIRTFQRDIQVPVTGKVTDELLRALTRASIERLSRTPMPR